MNNPTKVRKIIIDTDSGHDDALAIMLAVKSGLFDILAVTTVAGNSTIENTTRNARYIMGLLGREDIPVFSGAEKPLKRELRTATVHGASGLEGIDPSNEAMLTGDAVDRITALIAANQGEVTLVTIGPLTNIAQAIKKDSGTMKMLKEIVTMGGAVKVPGNMNRVAEFNVFVDPEAADTVFRFPVKKTMVPLDAYNRVQLQLEDFERITDTKIRGPVLAMMKAYFRNIGKDAGIKAALYDPLTVYYLINPDACEVKEHDILVEIKGTLTRGMTVAELRKTPEGNNMMSVVEKVDGRAFRECLIATLSK